MPADLPPKFHGSLRILAQGMPGLAEPLDPQTLASVHPLWAADVTALGPWRLVAWLGPGAGHRRLRAMLLDHGCGQGTCGAR